MAKKKKKETPLMKQYNEIKAKHPDAVLLFRVGDFYETFSTDAVKASEILGITLTKRANGSASYIELAGFPYHALDTYLPKLVRAGQRVAICEQLEDPKTTKKIVKRGITELVTPGVSLNDNVLEHRKNNFLAAVHLGKQLSGISFLDISTGEFYVAQGNKSYIDKLLSSFSPKEVLVERGMYRDFLEIFGDKYYTFKLEDWAFAEKASHERLLKQFDTVSLKGFGITHMTAGITAAGAVLHYLDLTQHSKIKHVASISRLSEDAYVWLDKFTVKNLELFSTYSDEGKSLLDIIDRTVSPPGARMMKRWLAFPLKSQEQILKRQNVTEYFMNASEELSDNFRKLIKQTGDLERMSSKISSQRINPRETEQLKDALYASEDIIKACKAGDNENLWLVADKINPCKEIRDRIEKELQDEPPVQLKKGGVIAEGVSDELDEYRKIAYSGKDYLDALQEKLARETGIASLKIAFNNVFGYYFEVRNKYKGQVPEHWTRKQTLVSAERYINEELKEYEEKILGAEEKIGVLEAELFNRLVLSLTDYLSILKKNAEEIAGLDSLISFSVVAKENNYVLPKVADEYVLNISEGRHPVIEQQLPPGEKYVANSVRMSREDQQIIIVTGPNMSGKSALLRQTALITILAQIGSYVPADAAEIGIVDKVFTRVGASDNISSGESTFMVEMNEAANILNNISDRSLILFDELGRGTSTYDGISIAWSIVEHLHEHPQVKAKTLFATHYHELNEMAKTFNRIKNFNVSVKEIDGKVIFLRKLEPGGSEHSFGIHVAKLAGMPRSIVKRANQILEELEQTHRKEDMIEKAGNLAGKREGYQMSMYQLDDPVLSEVRKEIENLDINNLTPIEALNKLHEIKKHLSI
ncbi:MAG: DNA mismatch repair protein MutS [Bacteroidota bacterium]|nr:DNA mismatch repair protein MutS [Bacteroidota bacterium]